MFRAFTERNPRFRSKSERRVALEKSSRSDDFDISGADANAGEFPSGQRGQTVNLLQLASVVRIHLPP